MARLTRQRPALLGAALVAASLILGACGSGAALSGARSACTKVNASLATYQAASAPGITQQMSIDLLAKAQTQLLSALPDAARATSADGSYNSLMTTIQEADRVPEGLLVDSLRRQCKVIFSNTPYLGI